MPVGKGWQMTQPPGSEGVKLSLLTPFLMAYVSLQYIIGIDAIGKPEELVHKASHCGSKRKQQ